MIKINLKQNKKIFEIMKNYTENKIVINDKEIRICGLTESHISYIEFTIENNQPIDNEITLFNIDYKELLKTFKNTEILVCDIHKTNKKGIITQYKINNKIYTNDTEYMKDTWNNHLNSSNSVISDNYEIFSNGSEISKIKIKNIKQFKNELKMIKSFENNRSCFKIYDDNFYFYYDTNKTEYKPSCDFYYEIISNSDIEVLKYYKYLDYEKSTYNINELYSIINKLNDDCIISYSIDTPLLLESSINNTDVKYMLAPVID